MNEIDVKRVCQQMCKLKLIAGYAVIDQNDQLRHQPVHFPFAIIQNTKPRRHFKNFPGSSAHWIGYFMYVKSGRLYSEYFNSIGLRGNHYKIKNPTHVKTIFSNNVRVQSNQSNLCGLFVLFYIACRSIGYSNLNIKHFLSINCHRTNDKSMKLFYQIIHSSKTKIEFQQRLKKLFNFKEMHCTTLNV